MHNRAVPLTESQMSPWLHRIDPIAIQFPEFTLFGMDFHPAVHWYGLMYAIGFGIAWWLGQRRIRQGRLPGAGDAAFGDLLFYGMLGVLVAAAWWTRRQRLHFFDTMDFVAPLVPAGLGFGRLGNYIGGELWGKPTGGDWGVVFPASLPAEYAALPAEQLRSLHASGALDAFARHPSQLYQAALEGLALGLVLWFYSRRPRPRYAVSGLFALGYGLFRFAVEFVREPDAHLGYLAFGWLTMGQLLSLPLIALGLFLLRLSHRSPTLAPVPPPAEKA